MRLENKKALVTGGGRGIGRAIALTFAKEGADVAIAEIDLTSAEKVVTEVRSTGCRSMATRTDVSNRNEIEEMVHAVEREFGRIDILVNNAGINMVSRSEDLSEQNWDKALNINLKAIFLCSQAVCKQMVKQNGGKIINIASIYGLSGYPERAAYCTSKAGVISLTQTLACEWARYGINVNAIAPGLIKTEMVRDLIRRGIFDEKTVAARSPMGRLGEPEEIANAALFLASDESNFVNGHTLVVDGGWSVYGYLQSWLDETGHQKKNL
jgi:NAD(P)-dependent dehydrogenase (short-subunit alcohol dehydrogenase family)